MGWAWRDFGQNTPSWNALNYIDSMLRQSRDPVLNVLTAARSFDNHDPMLPNILAKNVNAEIYVDIVCFALAEHSTQVVLTVTGPVAGQVCADERDRLVGDIFALNLD